MKYNVGDRVRVKATLTRGDYEGIPFGMNMLRLRGMVGTITHRTTSPKDVYVYQIDFEYLKGYISNYFDFTGTMLEPAGMSNSIETYYRSVMGGESYVTFEHKNSVEKFLKVVKGLGFDKFSTGMKIGNNITYYPKYKNRLAYKLNMETKTVEVHVMEKRWDDRYTDNGNGIWKDDMWKLETKIFLCSTRTGSLLFNYLSVYVPFESAMVSFKRKDVFI